MTKIDDENWLETKTNLVTGDSVEKQITPPYEHPETPSKTAIREEREARAASRAEKQQRA